MRKLAILLIAAAAVTLVWLQVVRSNRLPDEPQPIAWDREPCAECRMHIGEPGFAAQLVLDDGRVLNFDDPGCLLKYVREQQPRIHRAWVHHRTDDRWLPLDQAGFVAADHSPMGYKLAAVDPGTPGARDWKAVQP
ncbi:MAG TPA: hypothetical protein VL172_21905 [Kofleriaceae bacterium]|jgi:hypothetical protein|nr:hypothetical protein [Kofleriaceae bacterium]